MRFPPFPGNGRSAAGTSRLCPCQVHRPSCRPPEPSSQETICYGRGRAGRKLLAYRFGTGENVLIVTFAIHGWEDNFEQDGQLLVDTGNLLIET